MSLFIYGLLLRLLYMRCFAGKTLAANGAALFGLLLVAATMDYNIKLYDFPVLALSASCLLCFDTRCWKAYRVIFILYCFNKETAILQTGLFALLFIRTLPRRKFAHLLIFQCAAYLIIQSAIHWWFFNNAGAAFYWRGFQTLWLDLQTCSLEVLFIILLLCWIILRRWAEIPFLLRQSMWLFVACGAIYYFLGMRGEYRVFFEAFPAVTLVLSYSIFTMLKIPANQALHDIH